MLELVTAIRIIFLTLRMYVILYTLHVVVVFTILYSRNFLGSSCFTSLYISAARILFFLPPLCSFLYIHVPA